MAWLVLAKAFDRTAVPAAAHSCPAVPSKRQHPAQSLGAGRDLFAGYAPECSLRTRVAVRQGGSCGCPLVSDRGSPLTSKGSCLEVMFWFVFHASGPADGSGGLQRRQRTHCTLLQKRRQSLQSFWLAQRPSLKPGVRAPQLTAMFADRSDTF